MFTHPSDTLDSSDRVTTARSLGHSITASLMLTAACLLLSGKHAAPENHVRFAQNNAFTEHEVLSCHACTRALTTRMQPLCNHTRSQAYLGAPNQRPAGSTWAAAV